MDETHRLGPGDLYLDEVGRQAEPESAFTEGPPPAARFRFCELGGYRYGCRVLFCRFRFQCRQGPGQCGHVLLALPELLEQFLVSPVGFAEELLVVLREILEGLGALLQGAVCPVLRVPFLLLVRRRGMTIPAGR